MKSYYEELKEFLKDELIKDGVTDFENFEFELDNPFTIDGDYIKNRIAVCSSLHDRSKLLDAMTEVIRKRDQLIGHRKQIIAFKKRLEKLPNFVDCEDELEDAIADIDRIESVLIAGKSRFDEAEETINIYKKKNLTSSKLQKLAKFIESDCGVALSDKHIKTYNSIPDLSDEEKEKFNEFVEIYNDEINDNEKTKEEKEKQRLLKHKKKLEELDKRKLEEEKTKATVIEHFEFHEDELETVEEFIPNERSLLLFDNILNGNLIADIKVLFPKISDNSYYSIKNDLIILMTNKIDTLYEAIEEGNDINKELVKTYEGHLDDICNYFEKEETIVNEVTETKKEKANIYYSTSPRGKDYIYSDLDQFEDGKKEEILGLINKLEESKFSNNPTQQKKFTNHNRLKGIFELKKPNIRLIYKDLGHNNYYVLMLIKKTSSNDREIAKSIMERNRNCQPEYEFLKTNIENDIAIGNAKNKGKNITANLTATIKGSKVNII